MSLLASFLLGSVGTSSGTCNFTTTDNDLPPTNSDSSSGQQNNANNNNNTAEEELIGMLTQPPHHVNTDAASVEDDSSSFGGQTILSSAPSDTILAVRVGQTDTNPWPATGRTNYPLSVSTASSCYIDMDAVVENNNNTGSIPRQDSFASLSFHASSIDSSIEVEDHLESTELVSPYSIADQMRSTASFPSLDGYHSALPLKSTAIVMPHHRQRNGGNLQRQLNWYAQFNEEDWDNLRQRAKMAMRALNGPPSPRTPSSLRPFCLPPNPPDIQHEAALASPAISLQELGAPRSLPDCFVCAICSSAIVGALTLDCGCGTTVCSACWEYRSVSVTSEGETYALARDLDYEIVPAKSIPTEENKRCPCCWQSVHCPIPCHALDVAILEMVKGMGAEYAQFQQLYYERLRCWREEIMRRQEEGAPEDGAISDEALSRMIQEEEKHFYQARNRAVTPTLWVPGALSFIVAVVASVGLRVLTQRRGDGRCRAIEGRE